MLTQTSCTMGKEMIRISHGELSKVIDAYDLFDLINNSDDIHVNSRCVIDYYEDYILNHFVFIVE